jgi:MFS family permease
MGIGLVDPILSTIAESLHATPTQSELLFTTYLALTGVAMFFTSWLSSRIGTKRTLLIGLGIVIVFAAACSLSPAVGPIIGFRAGWGIGNALFISTALAAIVSAAVGGSANAIILYETALGIGMAFGPLIGGLLGSVTWRLPFAGTAVLMAVGLIAISLMLQGDTSNKSKQMRKSRKLTGQVGQVGRAGNADQVAQIGQASQPEKIAPVRLSAPFKALTDPGMGTMGIAAFFYNMAFFSTLAFPPFAFMQLGFTQPLGIGLVFFGWGALLAVSAVLIAPRLTRILPRTRVLQIAEIALAVILVACALSAHNLNTLIICVILAGIPLGLLNTVLTECSMEASDLPRPVASSTYSGCRFLGGAIAPPLCTVLASVSGTSWLPFLYGASMILVSCLIITVRRSSLARADQAIETPMEEAENIGLAAENIG